VIDRSVRFSAHASATIKELVPAKLPLVNLYRFTPAKLASEEEIAQAIKANIDRQPSPYDSHPAPVDRFRWARNVSTAPSRPEEDDALEVWSLFADRPAIEDAMTRRFRSGLWDLYGVDLKGPEQASVSDLRTVEGGGL